MPFVDLESNLPAERFSEDFLRKLSSSAATTLGKPEERMNLVVKAGLPMLIAGSYAPCVSLSVSALGATDSAEKNRAHSGHLLRFLSAELALPEDRIVIRFHALEPHQVGKNGTVMSFQ